MSGVNKIMNVMHSVLDIHINTKYEQNLNKILKWLVVT